MIKTGTHIIVSWDIKTKKESDRQQINDALRECLKHYSWIKTHSFFYLVKIETIREYYALEETLIKVCAGYEAQDKIISLIVSTPLKGISYGGQLPQKLWDKIKGE